MEVPDRFPNVVRVNIIRGGSVAMQRAQEIVDWCNDRFGAAWHTEKNPGGVWTTQLSGSSAIRFVHESDAFEFKMRWG